LRATAQHAWYRVDEAIVPALAGIRGYEAATYRPASRGQPDHHDRPDCLEYHASHSYYSFRKIMKRFVHPTREDVFLDYGSGLGRIVLMAATFPFRRVVGVEYSEELNREASRIIGGMKPRLRCRDIELVTADASTFALPGDTTVLYFYNPFLGEVLDRVIEKIEQSLMARPRKIKIVYCHPAAFEDRIRGRPWVCKKDEVIFPGVFTLRTVIFETDPARVRR